MAPWDSVLANHLVTQAAWTWEGHKTCAQLSLCPCGVPENLSRLDLGSAGNTGLLGTVPLQSTLEPEAV